jgi:hypothetical protein
MENVSKNLLHGSRRDNSIGQASHPVNVRHAQFQNKAKVIGGLVRQCSGYLVLVSEMGHVLSAVSSLVLCILDKARDR